jgi:hypothetical protein
MEFESPIIIAIIRGVDAAVMAPPSVSSQARAEIVGEYHVEYGDAAGEEEEEAGWEPASR